MKRIKFTIDKNDYQEWRDILKYLAQNNPQVGSVKIDIANNFAELLYFSESMKEGDLVMVSAEATGLGKPMEAVIDKIETFMGQTLVTVTYTQPDALSGFGGCFVESLIMLQNQDV